MSHCLGIKASYFYVLCGWRTRSDIPLTSLPSSQGTSASVDVRIEIVPNPSPIGKSAARGVAKHTAEYSLIRINGVADFEISEGRQIRVWPVTGTPQKDIEIFLFGPVWATLCHQREILPLHASAIVTEGRITAFAGHPGAGKSTTAALLGSFNYELMTDDILPINLDPDSVPGAWPYLRRLKLRGDSINRLGMTPVEQVSQLDSDKYFVLPKCAAADKWGSLERLYLLEINPADSRVSIEKITGAEAVHALVNYTYHFQFVLGSGRLGEHLSLCSQLASKITVYRVQRPQSFDGGRELGQIICAHLNNAPGHQY